MRKAEDSLFITVFGKRRKGKGHMKKCVSMAAFASIVVLSLVGCVHQHQWVDADCEKPMTCSECGETQGEPLGHQWVDADCINPKTCSRCGAMEGAALGHKWVAATMDSPKTCSVCQKTEGDSIGDTYKQALDNFGDGKLEKAKELFQQCDGCEEATNYLSLIERTLQYDGVYAEKGNEDLSWLVIEGGAVCHVSSGAGSGSSFEHVPYEEDGKLALMDKYEYQGISTIKDTQYVLTNINGNRAVESEGGLYGYKTYLLTDKDIDSFLDGHKSKPSKKAPTIGMTAQEVRDSTWGSPSKINRTRTSGGTHEQWVYSTNRYIYLDNGIVTSIQD